MRRMLALLALAALAACLCLFIEVPRHGHAGRMPGKEKTMHVGSKEQSSDDRAIGSYKQAEELNRTGHKAESYRILDDIVAKEHGSQYAPFALYQKANWLYYDGKVKESHQTFEEVKTRFPNSYLSIRAQEKLATMNLREKRLSAILGSTDPKPVRIVSAQDDGSKVSADCGPEALLEALKEFGLSATKSELKALSMTTDKGTTMLNLAKAARAKGLVAKGKIVNYTFLREKMEKPLIAWVDGNHYVCVKDVGENSVSIFDPNEGSKLVPRAEFSQRWQGHVLSLSMRNSRKRA